MRCDRSETGCGKRVRDANYSKIVAADPKRGAKRKKTHRTTQNDFARTFSDSFPTQMRCKRCKRSRCAFVAVQNDANGPQTHLSQFKTTQTRLLRTRRSSKRQKWTATHSSQLRIAESRQHRILLPTDNTDLHGWRHNGTLGVLWPCRTGSACSAPGDAGATEEG